ncbi:MAG: hypothetical protein ACI85K_002615, partial [Hyphomicrobiaceae bacterium]
MSAVGPSCRLQHLHEIKSAVGTDSDMDSIVHELARTGKV